MEKDCSLVEIGRASSRGICGRLCAVLGVINPDFFEDICFRYNLQLCIIAAQCSVHFFDSAASSIFEVVVNNVVPNWA